MRKKPVLNEPIPANFTWIHGPTALQVSNQNCVCERRHKQHGGLGGRVLIGCHSKHLPTGTVASDICSSGGDRLKIWVHLLEGVLK